MRGFEQNFFGPLLCACTHFYGHFQKRAVDPKFFFTVFAGFTSK
jgi:hypothetical protein